MSTAALNAAPASFQSFPYGGVIAISPNGARLSSSELFTPNPPQRTVLKAFGGTTVATALSVDGSIVAGYAWTQDAPFGRGWIKRPGEDYVDIGTLGGDAALVYGMSASGDALAGASRNAAAIWQGFRWAANGGMTPIPFPPNAVDAMASGISADGRVVMGTATVLCPECDNSGIVYDCAGVCDPPIVRYQQSYIWTEASGTMPLGTLHPTLPTTDPSGRPHAPEDTSATAISADGTTVVGYTFGPFEGFIWQAETGMRPLKTIGNKGNQVFPLDVSGDGSVVVGRMGGSCGTNCFSGPGAVIWDAQHGTRLLKTVLEDDYGLGPQIGNQFLEQATFISDDGRTIAGNNADTDHRWWIVTLPAAVPEPTSGELMLVAALVVLGSGRKCIAAKQRNIVRQLCEA